MNGLTSRAHALQQAARELPQCEDMVTDHYFADGMYVRALWRKAGTLIIGKVHKREHFYIVARGAVAVDTDSGPRVLEAGTVVVSKPGTKRAVLALTDAICLTVHRTDKKDLAEIEKELIEEDPEAMFNEKNELRRLPCPG